MTQPDFYAAVGNALYETDVTAKLSQVYVLYDAITQGDIAPYAADDLTEILPSGRPEKPELVSPRDVPRRKIGSKEGVHALIHSICHIEFNAINLGLDAAYRFRSMPERFYHDWLLVAKEEADHFSMLADYLTSVGSSYGAFTAHNGLWDSAERTAHDPLIRMALVPRVLEARGLDVTPGIINRLKEVGQTGVVAMLLRIMREEEGHVIIGNRWYQYLCRERNLDPKETFFSLLDEYEQTIRAPINTEARLRSGFTEEEIALLLESIDL